MNRKEQIKTGLFCVGVLLLVMACMGLPSAFCAVQQGRLLQTSHSRPAEENALSRQGQENALAKLLYDRQFLAGTTPEWDSTGWQVLEQTEEEQVNSIGAALEQMRKEGLLNETQTAAAYGLLETEQPDARKASLRDQSGKVLCSQTKIPALPVSGPVYRDGSSLYYMSSAEQYQNLWQVNVEDSERFGQCEEVCRWQLGENPYPLLCTEDGIVVERTSGTGEEENQGTTCLYLLRWDNTVQKIFEQDLAQGMIWKAEGDTALFAYQRVSGMLEQINPADGTLTKFAQVQPGIRYANPIHLTQNQLIYGWNDGEAHGQSWVEQNGQPVEIKALSRSHNGSVTDAIVLQVLGNGRLLADLGELEYPITETGTDGKVFSMNTSERLYGIFTLDEYCQSGKEYLSVQTEAEF